MLSISQFAKAAPLSQKKKKKIKKNTPCCLCLPGLSQGCAGLSNCHLQERNGESVSAEGTLGWKGNSSSVMARCGHQLAREHTHPTPHTGLEGCDTSCSALSPAWNVRIWRGTGGIAQVS